jgi:death-on-curing protein
MEHLTLEEARENIEYLVRDPGLLESAIHRTRWDFEKDSIPEKAAKIMSGILFNHPYLDGNKRASVRLSDAFLRKNQLRLGDSNPGKDSFEDRLYDLIVGIASGKYDENEADEFFGNNLSSNNTRDIFGFGQEYPQLIYRLGR